MKGVCNEEVHRTQRHPGVIRGSERRRCRHAARHADRLGHIVPIFGVSYSFSANNVIDGGTSFVGAGNDLSGNCDGDTGTVAEAGTTYTIVCAHFVASSRCCNTGSPKMRVAYQVGSTYVVARIIDNGASPDSFA